MANQIFKNAVSDEELFRLIEEKRRYARENFRKIAVLMGGGSEEREISLKTGKAVSSALISKGYEVKEVILPCSPEELKGFDSAFVCLHGRLGEDGSVQGFLEVLGIPYTSPDYVVSSLFMDKLITKFALSYLGIPQPKFAFVRDIESGVLTLKKFIKDFRKKTKGGKASRGKGGKKTHPTPIFIVKPSFSGSSFGISPVYGDESDYEIENIFRSAFRFSSTVLIEEFLGGPEITVGVFERKSLGVLEIRPESDVFFSFSAKYSSPETRYIIPPDSVSPDVCEKALLISSRICEVFQVGGAVRVDFKLKSHKSKTPYFLELNTIPGMTERSLLPKIAEWRGIRFDDFVEAILGCAKLKHNLR